MKINGVEIEKVVEIGKLMVMAHEEANTIMGAIDLFKEEYPDADSSMLALLWVGINCKDRESVSDQT